MTRKLTYLNLFTIAAVAVLPHFWPFSFFSYAPVCLLLVIWVLKKQKESLPTIGFQFRGFSWEAFSVGLIWAVAWALSYQELIGPFLKNICHLPKADVSAFNFIKHNPIPYALILLAAWLIGGWYEEIIFRGFIQSRISAWFTSNRHAPIFAAVITGIIFGLYHCQQGISGVIHASLFSIIPSYFLIKYKGNLWYGMLFHALYDTIGLTLIFLDYH